MEPLISVLVIRAVERLFILVAGLVLIHRAINYANLVSKSLHHLVGGPWDAYVDMHSVAWSEAGYVAKALRYPKGRWHDDHGKKMETGDYHILEQRYYASSRRLDGRTND